MKKKQIGVWLDHVHAMLLEPGQLSDQIITIKTEDIHNYREHGETSDSTMFSSASGKGFHVSNNEYKKNRSEENDQKKYYQKIENVLSKYDEILLFGPAKAQEELHNRMMENKVFANKKIRIESSDKLTPNQLAAKINDFFNVASE